MSIYKHGEATEHNFVQTTNLSIINCLVELLPRSLKLVKILVCIFILEYFFIKT